MTSIQDDPVLWSRHAWGSTIQNAVCRLGDCSKSSVASSPYAKPRRRARSSRATGRSERLPSGGRLGAPPRSPHCEPDAAAGAQEQRGRLGRDRPDAGSAVVPGLRSGLCIQIADVEVDVLAHSRRAERRDVVREDAVRDVDAPVDDVAVPVIPHFHFV